MTRREVAIIKHADAIQRAVCAKHYKDDCYECPFLTGDRGDCTVGMLPSERDYASIDAVKSDGKAAIG